MQPKITVTWKRHRMLVEGLAYLIAKDRYRPDMIVAVATGGLIPGLILAKLFKVPFSSVAAESYRSETGRGRKNKKGRMRFTRVLSKTVPGIGQRLLVVDDLTDSGDTLTVTVEWLRAAFPTVKEVRTAVLWHKTCSHFIPDYHVLRIGPRKKKWPWIIQPIEEYETTSLAGLVRRLGKTKNRHTRHRPS